MKSMYNMDQHDRIFIWNIHLLFFCFFIYLFMRINMNFIGESSFLFQDVSNSEMQQNIWLSII